MRFDSSGPIYRRDDIDSKSMSKFEFISIIVALYQKLSILVIIFDFFDQIRPFSIKFNDFRYKFEYKIEFRHGFRSNIVTTIDRTGKFGLKMSIKRRLDYDLDQIFGRPRLDRISLQHRILTRNVFKALKDHNEKIHMPFWGQS